jgi:anti-sigma factor (TIGR02949 family)
MTEPTHGHDDLDECVAALTKVHAFLHGELLEADADVIRHHLHACERCMENFEIEATIDEMIRRTHRIARAPSSLVVRVRSLRIKRG